jgi:hypothetical protein
MRRILIVFLTLGLSACGVVHAKFALFGPHRHGADTAAAAPTPAPVPTVADGLWAVLDPGCPKPAQADIHAWPKCAFPFWISRGKALVLHSAYHGARAPTDVSFVADYSLSPGDPLIAQVGTEKDGYMFLALTQLSRDDQGRVISAVGAAVACPQAPSGTLAIKPSLNGCEAQSIDAVRKAAAATLQDRSALAEADWIAPGAPGGL